MINKIAVLVIATFVPLVAGVAEQPTEVADLNGEGSPDYVLQNGSTQAAGIDLPAQSSPTSSPSVARALVAPYFNSVDPGIVLQNASTHKTKVWFLEKTGNTYNLVYAPFGPTLPAGWEVKCVDRFTWYGFPGYALFNANTRQTAVWYLDMPGTWYLSHPTFIGSSHAPTIPNGWELAATGDFTQDGTADYVLCNPSTGQTKVWYLNNTAGDGHQTGTIIFVRAAAGPTLPAGWSLIGVADFDGDGELDYALFNPTTRQTMIWYLNGTTAIGSANGPTVPLGWALVATADFDGDGYPDYLLYNASTRQTKVWHLNVNIRVGVANGPTIPPGWSLVVP